MNNAYLQDLMVFVGYMALFILQKLPLLILQLNISSEVGNVTYNLSVEIARFDDLIYASVVYLKLAEVMVDCVS